MIIFSCVAAMAHATPQYQNILAIISLGEIINTVGWIFAILILCITMKR
jgi:hypothetical protein